MADIYDISGYRLGDVMNTDIGLMNMDKQITVPGFAYGPSFNMSGITMQGGLDTDKVELTSQKEKDKKIWSKIFLGAGILAAGLLGWKYGKAGVVKVWEGTKNLFSKLTAKFKK